MATAPNETPSDNPIKTSIEVLHKDLEQLAIITQKPRRLHTLRVRAWGFPRPGPFDSTKVYLPLPTLRALFWVENLRVLVLPRSIWRLSGFARAAWKQPAYLSSYWRPSLYSSNPSPTHAQHLPRCFDTPRSQ